MTTFGHLAPQVEEEIDFEQRRVRHMETVPQPPRTEVAVGQALGGWLYKWSILIMRDDAIRDEIMVKCYIHITYSITYCIDIL